MTQFTQASFTVGEDSRSEVSDAERRAHWAETFGKLCGPCAAKDWTQEPPARLVQCPGCEKWFCREHLEEHRGDDVVGDAGGGEP